MAQHTHVIKPDMKRNYPTISHGKGIYLYDTTGKKYLDGSSGAITANIGHAVDEIAEAIYAQAKKVSFAFRGHFSSEVVEQLGAKLAAWAPGDINWCFFVNSGSEANEMAQRIAIQYWQEKGYSTKNRIISRWMSYHGNTVGALSMSGHVIRRRQFDDILADYPCISTPYYYRYGRNLSPEEYGRQCAEELEAAILRYGPENVAAFIAEPITGASGGAVVPPPNYFPLVREICDKYDILLIADEVMTGMGRTGKNFGIDHFQVVPDIMALGKGMTAGYTPMAATLVSDKIIQTINQGTGVIISGHTYSANPQSAAAGLAVVNYLEKHDLVRKAADRGAYLLSQLEKLQKEFEIVGDARGKGMLCALEFVKDKETKEPFPRSMGVAERVIDRAFDKGLIVYPAVGGINGAAGDAILVAPPLTIEPHEIDILIDLLASAIKEIEREL